MESVYRDVYEKLRHTIQDNQQGEEDDIESAKDEENTRYRSLSVEWRTRAVTRHVS